MGPKHIRDPIHGYITVEDAVLGVLDTPAVQRLRHVRQLGTASLVYPGANHTRFEHALGAFSLGARAASQLSLAAEEALDLRLALLLHDVGHGPFSHLCEPAMRRALGVGHKDLSLKLVQGELRPSIEAAGASPARIAELIDGRGPLGPLVSGDLDLDRMDYLVRDAHYTGVEVGVDLDRLLGALTLHGGQPALRDDALHAAEVLLVTRFLMYSTVYYHRAARIAERMVDRAMQVAMDEGYFTAAAMVRMDDGELLHRLRAAPGVPSALAAMLDGRALLKCATEATAEQAGKQAEALRRDRDRAAFEQELAAQAGCDPRLVIVDLPDMPVVREVRALVVDPEGKAQPLSARSSLVASLPKAQLDHWRLRVFGPSEARGALARATRARLG
ncbi:MAG TPA: HD domain-containing protein [Candidatus Thermoplasmatota archaeon]|nr:HD domain-containing protein [Candidatus Thermoplasmatota archaeon]